MPLQIYGLNDGVVTHLSGFTIYHPHPHGRTGYQVYGEMAGLLLIKDDVERNLNLPAGDDEILFVIQDRTFNAENQLVYLPGGMIRNYYISKGAKTT